MTRTTANELITDESGRVTGVKATQYDGTPVTVTANKGCNSRDRRLWREH